MDTGRESGYLWGEVEMDAERIKRIADFLEKLAVAGIALGIYQGNAMGVLAVPIFAISLYLTRGKQ